MCDATSDSSPPQAPEEQAEETTMSGTTPDASSPQAPEEQLEETTLGSNEDQMLDNGILISSGSDVEHTPAAETLIPSDEAFSPTEEDQLNEDGTLVPSDDEEEHHHMSKRRR